jgi:predicted ribosome quality control (RQC) complex YloA/Tae2 family protein
MDIKESELQVQAVDFFKNKEKFHLLNHAVQAYMPEEKEMLFNPEKWGKDQYLQKLKKDFYNFRKIIKTTHKRLCRKIKGVRKDLGETVKMDVLKLHADLLMAYPDKIEPKAETVILEDFYTGNKVEISLDPSLNPMENAEKFYKKYRKLKKRVTLCNEHLEKLGIHEYFIEEQLLFLDDIDLENTEELEQLIFSIAEYIRKSPGDNRVFSVSDREKLYRIFSGLSEKFQTLYSCTDLRIKEKSSRRKKGASQAKKGAARGVPLLKEYTGLAGLSVLIGSGSVQNDFLTFKVARKDDLWFHARGIPGAHVIARISGMNIGEETAEYQNIIDVCSGLAAHFSKASTNSRVTVQYTLKKHLRKTRDLPPGMTLVPKEKTITVKPLCPDEDQIRKLRPSFS